MPPSVRFLLQTALLILVYHGCARFVAWADFPIPANVLGLIVLFVLLCTGIVKEKHLAEAAGFFLKHLSFFFVTVGVGLINWGAVFYDYGLVLLLAIVVSSLIPLYVVGVVTQKLGEKR
ncbi:MAG: CidA/LrgA family protein [Candidatus Adiutrix sp.]|jgi:holin-like protein|nr:CidA/LrgA family protein [Candidatus Adiutrix sp.]